MPTLHTRPIDATAEDTTRLIADLDVYLSSLYPAESTHLLAVATFLEPDGVFLGAFDGDRLARPVRLLTLRTMTFGECVNPLAQSDGPDGDLVPPGQTAGFFPMWTLYVNAAATRTASPTARTAPR